MNYELLVIGNGREAIDGALAAARRAELVALVRTVGIDHGGITIDALRRAASSHSGAGPFRMSALRGAATRMAGEQWLADRAKLGSLNVDVFCGGVRFAGERTVEVIDRATEVGDRIDSSSSRQTLTARRIVLACGTRSARPSHVRFDSRRILDVESLLMLDELPRSMIVVGAGESDVGDATLDLHGHAIGHGNLPAGAQGPTRLPWV